MWIPTPNGTASVARLHVPRHEKGHVPSTIHLVSGYNDPQPPQTSCTNFSEKSLRISIDPWNGWQRSERLPGGALDPVVSGVISPKL